MPGAVRIGDKARCPSDFHGCVGCPHSVIGPAITGSADVLINGKPAVRMGDSGIHSACCGANTWVASQGSPNVFINGRPAVRIGDQTTHCGGIGRMIEGSQDVLINQGTATKSGKPGKPHGGISPTIQDALKAKKEALKLLDQKIDELQNHWDDIAIKRQFASRFGTDDDTIKEEVLRRLRKIRKAIAHLKASNFRQVPPSQSRPGRYGFVDPKDSRHTIFLDQEFAKASMTGRDSKAGTIVHEVSHFNDVVGTEDIAYGEEADLLVDPLDTINNADTIDRYVEDAYVSDQGVR